MPKRFLLLLLRSVLALVLLSTVLSGLPALAVDGDPPATPQMDDGAMVSEPLVEIEAEPVEDPRDVELREILLQFTRIRGQGPEAILAFAENLQGDALDMLQDEIDAAREEMRVLRPAAQPIAGPPMSEADEVQMNQQELIAAAASRERALLHQDDPAELAAVLEASAASSPSIESPSQTEATYRNVGSGCTYSSIAAAIAASNPGDVLRLEGGVTLSGGFTIDKNLTIEGGYSGCASGSTAWTTISGLGFVQGMVINAGLDVLLRKVIITSGTAGTGSGGGIMFASGNSGGTLTLEYVTIQNSSAAYGGGLWAGPNSNVIGDYVNITNNTASVYGGGVRLMGASAEFRNSNIINNSAPSGAGIYGTASTYPSITLDLVYAADVRDNTATTGAATGGGIYFQEGEINLDSASDIYSNDAGYGGGMYLITTTVTLEGSDVELQSNTATQDGGGLWAVGSTININDRAEIINNTATIRGGGAYLDDSDLFVSQGGIVDNTATTNHGGGVYATNGASLNMDADTYGCTGSRCTRLYGNTAAGGSGSNGGGVYAVGTSTTVNVQETWVEENEAYYGGGIYVTGGSLFLYNALIARNYNTYTGTPAADGVRIIGATMTGSHNTIAYNDVGGAATGGAIASASSTMNLSNSIIWGHSTSISDPGQTVTCSDIQGGYSGTDNRNENPLFVNAGTYDYHLQTSSPVIDRCATGDGQDFDQDSRPIYDVRPSTPFDMGADEAGVARVGINNNGCQYTNIQAAVDNASAGDTIKVSAGTFTENVDVSQNLTIQGGYSAVDCTTEGAGTTIIDGSAVGSVIDVTGGFLTLRDLELTNGAGYGAGLDMLGSNALLENVAVHHNNGLLGGGIFIGSSSAVTTTGNSDISYNTATSNGGGVYVEGRFRAEDNDADIMYNQAPHGGGICVDNGEVELWNSDVYQNDATAANGKGGGIYAVDESTVTLANSTFIYFQNTAYDGAGIYADNNSTITTAFGAVVFRDNVASNDGGAIYLNNNSSFTGSAHIGQQVTGLQNQAQNGAGIFSINSTVDLAGNIINNKAFTKGAGLYAENSLITLTDVDVGGLTDQETNILTGANVQGAGLYLTANTQAILLRTNIISNTAPSSPDTVLGLGMMLAGGSVLTMTDSSIHDHDAFGALNASGAGLYVDSATATLSNCDILSNTASHDGAGIYVHDTSTLNLESSLVENNDAGVSGGGLAINLGTPDININNTDFKKNDATDYGGGIYMTSGDLDITGGWSIRQNDAGMNGGGLAILGATGILIQADAYSLAYANEAAGVGGFLYNTASTGVEVRAADLPSMYIYANSAGGGGGAFAMDAGTLSLYGELNFDRNASYGASGGAVYLSNNAAAHHHLLNGVGQTYWDNRADMGGAIYADTAAVITCNGTIFGSQADYNQAMNGSGGSIYLAGGTLNAVNTTFIQGSATQHGGAIAAFNATVDIDADFTSCNPLTTECSVLSNNIADADADDDGDGGAIYAEDSDVTLGQSHIYGNTAYRGGAFYQTGASADGTIENTLIVSNTITSGFGAGVRSVNGLMSVTHTTIADNNGGAGYSQSNTTATINRSIAWGNTSGGFWKTSGTMGGACNIDESANIGITGDPMFVDAPNGDYHLQPNSPAVDACESGLALDLDGNERPLGTGHDMGAYELIWNKTFMPMALKDF